jgi:hypothetical protein
MKKKAKYRIRLGLPAERLQLPWIVIGYTDDDRAVYRVKDVKITSPVWTTTVENDTKDAGPFLYFIETEGSVRIENEIAYID